ncbi:hypothetical protein BSKO_01182 [Bryopsis sp. KO-2023]|nr:hypothetical protein BSKO_01182 [Bryopsis sp. KO-2023]
MAASNDPQDIASLFGLEVVDAADATGRPNLQDDGEEVRGEYQDVQLVLGCNLIQGQGDLFITTKRVVWMKSGAASRGFAVDYQNIVMHAVSRDPEVASRACIYTQLDTSLQHDEDDEGVDPPDPEMRLIPAEEGKVEEMFHVLSECAALNPDPLDETDEGDGFFYDSERALANSDLSLMEEALEGIEITTGEGDLEELVGNDPERFQDAEDEADDEAPAQQKMGNGDLSH